MNDFAPPPTKELVAMRKKHTQQSVAYNMNHFQDHFSDTQKSIKKLGSVDPKLAAKHQSKVSSSLSSMLNRTKGAPMQKVKTSSSYKGKSNAPGGGGRFKQMTDKGMSPGLVAFIGKKKYGAKKMSAMAAAGRSKKSA